MATARRERAAPTLQQVKHAIASMRGNTDNERRDRALVEFTLMTGTRDSALASTKFKRADLASGNAFRTRVNCRLSSAKASRLTFGSDVRQFFDWAGFELGLRSLEQLTVDCQEVHT